MEHEDRAAAFQVASLLASSKGGEDKLMEADLKPEDDRAPTKQDTIASSHVITDKPRSIGVDELNLRHSNRFS